MLVYADARAIQDPVTVERGIGRYITEVALEVERHHPGAIGSWVLRADLPIPVHTPALVRNARYRTEGDPDLRPPEIWHQCSPFESLDDPIDAMWPIWARSTRTRLVTTLYDLIPLHYSDQYLRAPAIRHAYLARLELLRHSDRILAISEATARDGVRLLGIPPRKFEVVGAGVSTAFVPADSTDHSFATAAAGVPDLRAGYLMYTGGIDFRKNIDGLLVGYSEMPAEIRARHQLVIVCRLQPNEREHLEQLAATLGIDRDLVLTGFVHQDLLLTLYQAAHLFVFPSLYEGYGLPVAEALSCGVPAIVGANSSLTEVVRDPRAQFDASSPQAIASTMVRVLGDEALRASLRREGLEADHSWSAVAERTLEAYLQVAAPPLRTPSRPRVALITPMPPAASGVADYSAAMLEHLRRRASVDVFTDPGADRPDLPGVRWYTYRQFSSVERMHGPHDARIFALGNSEHHIEVFELLSARGGTVMSHDVRYTGLMSLVLHARPRIVDTRTKELLVDLAAGRRPRAHEEHISIAPADYYLLNGLLCEPVFTPANLALVHSDVAAMLARANLPVDQQVKVKVVPFGHRLRSTSDPSQRDTVASFGIVHRLKESVTVCRAFIELARRHRGLTFALVGRVVDRDTREEIDAMIAESGLSDRVVVTGRVSAEEYDAWLARAQVAVQLRLHSNGETSAAVADCLGAGVPVVTSNTGALAELGHCTRLVEPAVEVEELVRAIERLLLDDEDRADLAKRGRAHAEANSFARAADAILELALAGSR